MPEKICRTLTLPTLLLALVGCGAVGPTHQLPDVSPRSGWMSQAGGEIDAKVLARWWATLGDPTLEKIVDQALARNLDLRQALAGIEGARALLARAVPIWQQTHAQIEAPLADPDRLREELNRLSRLTL